MGQICWVILLSAVVVCACGPSQKGYDDAAPPVDAAAPSIDANDVPTAIMQTSGGGEMSSPTFKARVRIGGPQPVRPAQSDTLRVEPGK